MLMKAKKAEAFNQINAGYNAIFRPERLTIGLMVPIESYPGGPVPAMEQHLERVQLAEALGFSAVWLRLRRYGHAAQACLADSPGISRRGPRPG